MDDVAFHRPHLTGREAQALDAALRSGHLRGDGPFTERVSNDLVRHHGGGHVLLTSSGTHALELAALLLDLRPGDEVVVPSFTFVSTASAFARQGATPVFVDVDRQSLGLAADGVRAAITDRTRAIVVVHYGDAPTDMDAVEQIAGDAGIPLIEDNALGFGGGWRGRPLGAIGAMSTLSFHETKSVQCGEGGALVVHDPELAERAAVLREKGTNRRAFDRGDVDRYTWVEIGSSYLLAEPLAAILSVQVDAMDGILERRRTLRARYLDRLEGWAQDTGASLPRPRPTATTSAHVFPVLLADPQQRARFIAHLAAAGVESRFHYVPLHLSPVGQRIGRHADLAITERAASSLVRLPLYPDLTDAEAERVIAAVAAFRPDRR